MISLQPEASNQGPIHLEKRKDAVAVTAPIANDPSAFCVAAGEQ